MATTPTDTDVEIEQLEGALRGELIRAGEPAFDDARTIYNAMIDKDPRVIARCVNVADVIEAVTFGRDHGLKTAIRSGGHGYLSRTYGLSIDNLLSADVVLADGRLVHASEDENPDLFWALRGGGGNFGVVTSFEFQSHPVETVVAGPLFWPIDELETTMRWYRDWLPDAPDDVYAFYLIAEVPGDPFPEEIQPARDIAEPLFEHVDPMPYPTLQGMFDDLYPPGDQWY